MKNEFFGSKLNTALLLLLIILMVIAIRIMLENKDIYFHPLTEQPVESNTPETVRQISGRAEDLVSFSILPNSKVHGIMSYRGVIKGGYFFEGNIIVNVDDANEKVILKSNAVAKTDWTTTGPVSFEGNLDFSNLPKGSAYIEIHNDNASGLPENDKSIFIPIVIE